MFQPGQPLYALMAPDPVPDVAMTWHRHTGHIQARSVTAHWTLDTDNILRYYILLYGFVVGIIVISNLLNHSHVVSKPII